MRGRNPLGSLAASPTMVGAVTVLIVIVAVFLAYNANNGLPFVPVYRVQVEVPNAARLTDNNEVRIGGHRVGVVEQIEPVVLNEDSDQTAAADGGQSGAEAATESDRIGARLTLKLDKAAEDLPVDSVFRVRYRSSFGLKYLEIVRGTSERTAPEGYTFDGTDDSAECLLPSDPDVVSNEIPESARNGCFQSQTEFDAINNTFDRPTRSNSRMNLLGYGTAFAARGTSLNEAIRSLRPLFQNLKPVVETLLEDDTRFRRFFPELADAARIVAPVAEEQAELFTNMAITFAAISSDTQALRDTITEGVPTLETGIETLPRQRPFLRDFTTLSRELRPGVADLRPTLPVLNEALVTGTPVLNRTPQMNERLEDVFAEVEDLAERPSTMLSLRRLEETFDVAAPLVRHVAPAQTVCNYFTYFFTSLPNGLSDRDQVGYSFRQALTGFPRGGSVIDIQPGPGETEFPIPGEVAVNQAGYAGIASNGREWDEHGAAPGGRDFDTRGDDFIPWGVGDRPGTPQDEGQDAAPILSGQPYGPTAQNYPGMERDDCQGGQNGYMLGRTHIPGQPQNNPANLGNREVFGDAEFNDLPGSRGPTTLYWTRDADRKLKDTRVPSRAPETWDRLR